MGCREAWRDTAAEGNPDWNHSQLQAGPLSFPHPLFLSEKLKKQEENDRGKPAEMLSPHVPEQGPGTCGVSKARASVLQGHLGEG